MFSIFVLFHTTQCDLGEEVTINGTLLSQRIIVMQQPRKRLVFPVQPINFTVLTYFTEKVLT